MSALPAWDDLIAGRGCPLCDLKDSNDYHIKVADLSTSRLVLERNQTYRGYCVLIFTGRHVTGIEQLSEEEYAAYAADLRRAARAIAAAVEPDHMNYATLGNVIPHLHYHIMPRYLHDPRWGAPIWTSDLKDMQKTHMDDTALQALRDRIIRFL